MSQFLLICSLNLPWYNLRPFRLVLWGYLLEGFVVFLHCPYVSLLSFVWASFLYKESSLFCLQKLSKRVLVVCDRKFHPTVNNCHHNKQGLSHLPWNLEIWVLFSVIDLYFEFGAWIFVCFGDFLHNHKVKGFSNCRNSYFKESAKYHKDKQPGDGSS